MAIVGRSLETPLSKDLLDISGRLAIPGNAACAFNRDGSTVGFALGDGRVRLLPADLKAAAAEAGDAVHGGAVLCLAGDPAGDGFVSGGDDGRLLRVVPPQPR